MIHLLEINAATTPQNLGKMARKLAMTGGFELTIADELSRQELAQLAELFIPELEKFQPLTSRRMGSNTNRLLNLVYSHHNADESLRERLGRVLNQYGKGELSGSPGS